MFSLAAFGGALDYAFGKISTDILSIATLQRDAIYVLLAFLLATDRQGPMRERLKLWGWMVLGGFLLFLAIHDISDRGHRRQTIIALFSQPGVYLWVVTLWQATALVAPCRPDGVPRQPLFRFGIVALLAYDALCLASSAASVSHDISFHYYYMERALLFAPLFGWMRAAECDRTLRRQTAAALTGWLAAIILIAGAIGVMDNLGPQSLRSTLVDWKLIYMRTTDAGPGFPERRLQFPMLHFNRTAYFGMLALFAVLAASAGQSLQTRRPLRTFLFGVACAGFAVILLSYTRGIILAVLIGLVVWGSLGSRRLIIGLAVACLLIAALLRGEQRKFLMTAFDSATYQVDQGELTSMKARMIAYRFGLKRIAQYPLTGMGYGDKIVSTDYVKYQEGPQGDPRALASIRAGFAMVHLHDVWIEIGVESGLLAVAAFLAFMLARWGLLWKKWRGASGPDRRPWSVWIGFEAALLISGLVFYMLKQNSGMLTWELMAFVFVAAADPPAEDFQPIETARSSA